MIKKQTILLTCCVLIGLVSKGQININPQIESYKSALLQKDIERKKAIEDYVTVNQISKEFYDKKRNYHFIHHIDELGRPIYYKSHSNVGLATTIHTNKLWNGGGLGLDLQGQGMEVNASRARLGIWEPGPAMTAHKDFEGRATTRDLPVFSVTNGDAEHATHCAGTMVGAGLIAETRGMANKAKIDCYEIQTTEELEMLTAAAEGMLISNHSYGPSYDATKTVQGMYNGECATYDSILYLNKYYLPLFAIGNERDDANAITYDVASGGGIAKNVLGVGAVEIIAGGYTGPASVIMTDFSNYGPADDSRIKPDFVAPGKDIYSATSTNDTAHIANSGTSMSTPGAAGSLFLLQQHFKNKKSVFMKSATLKALAIHTCEEAGAAPGPDAKFGWGLLNIEKAINVIDNASAAHILEEASLANTTTYNKLVNTNGGTFRATICWTDLPGIPTSASTKDDRTAKLINDLDLRIIDSATNTAIATLPWKLDALNAAGNATQGDNVVDNVEQIYVANIPAGAYFIRVTHKGTLSASQEFALMVSGLTNSTGGTSDIVAVDKKPFIIYPNPTKGEFQIDLGTRFEMVDMQIKDIQGKTVANKQFKNIDKIAHQIEGPKGIYFIEMNTHIGKPTQMQIVKE
ncbi:MAG: S8 family serine peptidase [Bacteroidetes bacterium]|nr:S8 family serine peptidase [Bacteroidota bacterium]